MSMWKLRLASALFCGLAIGSIFSTAVHAAGTSGGLDSTTDTLPISVNGQQTITLTANDPAGTPPSVAGIAVTSPMNFGQTTAGVWTTNASIDPATGNVIATGNLTVGSNLTTQPASVLTVNGPIVDGGTTVASDGSTTIGSNAPTTPAVVLTVNGNVAILGTAVPSADCSAFVVGTVAQDGTG